MGQNPHCGRQPPRLRPQRQALARPSRLTRLRKRVRAAAAAAGRPEYRARWALGLVVLTVLAGALLTLPANLLPEQGPAVAQLEQLDAGTEAPDAGVTVDLRQDMGEKLSGQKMPEKPDPKWARPPCGPGYVALRGACWFPGALKPPCPPGVYEHEGRCYAPVLSGPKVPTSVEP